MTTEIVGHLVSGIVGALLTAAVFAIALGGRVIKLETRIDAMVSTFTQRIDVLDKHLTSLLSSLGTLLRDDILRRIRESEDERFNR